MIVLIIKRDGSEQWCMTGVERVEEDEHLSVRLVSNHSEPHILDRDYWRIDIVGVG